MDDQYVLRFVVTGKSGHATCEIFSCSLFSFMAVLLCGADGTAANLR